MCWRGQILKIGKELSIECAICTIDLRTAFHTVENVYQKSIPGN